MKKQTSKLSAGASGSELEQKALAYFSAGRYKEAADLFKDMLKSADNPAHRQQLAQCYLQRAFNMAAKGMQKEACILWENYAGLAQSPLVALDSYILWQLAANNTAKAYERLAQLTVRQLDEDYSQLAVCLGYLMLSGHVDLARHLPPESSLLVHFAWAREALAAYSNQQTGQCDEILQKLPFRSAFRDFRSLLRAQLVSVTSVEQARTLLSKIPDASPYRPMANALLAYTQSGADFVATLSNLEHNQRRLVAHAKGLSGKHMDLLETLIKQKPQLNDKARFNLVLQYRTLFGAEQAKAYCLGMLEHYPAGHKDYLKQFGVENRFEEHRIQALLCEKGKNSYDAHFYWRRCIDILKNDIPENNRKIAAILKHMAATTSPGEAVGLLIESLDYVPDDRDSYISILAHYDRDRPDPGKYQQWLELGLQHFPADIDLLMRAAKAAADRKAFKKAVGYAQTLLKIDPVNTLAKHLLFASHLAHARRLINAEKFRLVEKEIQAAEQLTVDKRLRLHADLLRAYYQWLAEDKNLGLQRIVETLAKLNADPVSMQFQAQMEAGLLDQPTTQLTRALPAFKDYLLSSGELPRLIASIEYYDEQLDDRALLFKALDKIKAPLKKSIQWLLDHEDLLLAWCEVLARIGCFELLKHCAKLANPKWPKPIWMYYRVVGDCQGDASRMDLMAQYRLKLAIEDARADNDAKTAFLIGRFIEQHFGNSTPFDLEDDFAEPGEAIQDDDPLEDLFGHIPESVMDKIGKKTQDIMLNTGPERFVANHIRQHSNIIDAQRLAALFMNPDFFSAVALLAAADALKIEIGLSFEDIVHRFENDSPQLSLPFL